MKDDRPDYSIIIPVYFNEETLPDCFNAVYQEVVRRNKDKRCEIIFVDDGSGDDSLQKLLEIRDANPDLVRVVKLTRNFGQVFAIAAGYEVASGRCLINISADLQDPPELINEMLDCFFQDNYQIVVCTRKSREESFYRRVTSRFFYKIIRKLSFSNLPIGGFDFALISERVKEIILGEKDANPFWQGQILQTGYKVKFIPYDRRNRPAGKSRWTFGMKIKYLIDGVMSYSYLPLRLMSIIGGIVALIGFGYAGIIIIAKLFIGGIPFKGWAPLMVLILVLSGIQMIMLGTIGEYLWRALAQARNRKTYIIDKIYE